MSGFIEGEARAQATLFPERIDDYITEENPVQVVDVFVDSIDLPNIGFNLLPADTGRPAYHPATMLAAYSFLIFLVGVYEYLKLGQLPYGKEWLAQ